MIPAVLFTAALLILISVGAGILVELAGVAFYCRCAWLDVVEG